MAAPKGNQYALGNDGGRPLAFNSVEELQEKIDEYFESDDAHTVYTNESGTTRVPTPTMSGLALYLDVDRKTLVNYSRKEEYFHTVKKARARVEQFLEKKLYGNNVTGTIFSLKNNFDWADKQQLDHQSSDGSMTPQSYSPEQYNDAADNLKGDMPGLD